MKIVEVVIEKFRSVKKAKFNMHNITAISLRQITPIGTPKVAFTRQTVWNCEL